MCIVNMLNIGTQYLYLWLKGNCDDKVFKDIYPRNLSKVFQVFKDLL